MNNLISILTVILLIITLIVLAVKGVLLALATTHWGLVVLGLLLLTNKYTRKALLIAVLITCILYLLFM